MSTVVVATSAADARAVEAVKEHHAQLAGALSAQVEASLNAASRGDTHGAAASPKALVSWSPAERVHHTHAEAQGL